MKEHAHPQEKKKERRNRNKGARTHRSTNNSKAYVERGRTLKEKHTFLREQVGNSALYEFWTDFYGM